MKTVLLASMLSTLLTADPHTKLIDKPAILPEKCPSISSMSTQGLDHVAPYIPGRAWIGIKENTHYDTNDTWTFIFFTDSKEINGKAALKDLTKKISSYHLKSEPKWDDSVGVAYCEYEAENLSFAVAYTPSLYE